MNCDGVEVDVDVGAGSDVGNGDGDFGGCDDGGGDDGYVCERGVGDDLSFFMVINIKITTYIYIYIYCHHHYHYQYFFCNTCKASFSHPKRRTKLPKLGGGGGFANSGNILK